MIQHLRGVWQFRYFWLSLVRLDLRNRYRRSVLGIGWSLLHPIAMTVVLCVAFSDILGSQSWRVYAPFLLAGMTIWEFIRGSATQGCDAFVRAEAYIRQCPLPYSIYPLRTVLGTLIHFVIGMGVVVAAAELLREPTAPSPLPAVGYVLPAVLLVTVFSWGLATLAAFAHAYFHDTKHLFDVGSQLFFFLTPIMYYRDTLDKKGLGWLADLNPVNLFLDLIRAPLLDGQPPAAELYTAAAVLTAATFGLACGAMAWLQKKVIFQL